nr:hypothetical protein GCM10020093_014230 [Planobispora longispora]
MRPVHRAAARGRRALPLLRRRNDHRGPGGRARRGAPLDELVRSRVTGPLGLADTVYRPGGPLLSRTVATEHKTERPRSGCVRGEVHDETAYGLGGVAGHAGIFSTAGDLLRFAETLRGGEDPSCARTPSRR